MEATAWWAGEGWVFGPAVSSEQSSGPLGKGAAWWAGQGPAGGRGLSSSGTCSVYTACPLCCVYTASPLCCVWRHPLKRPHQVRDLPVLCLPPGFFIKPTPAPSPGHPCLACARAAGSALHLSPWPRLPAPHTTDPSVPV